MKIRLLAHSESARRPDQLTGGVNEYRYCRELGQLGLTSTSRWSFFVAVGGSLASLGLFNCLQDGRARVAAAGSLLVQRGTLRGNAFQRNGATCIGTTHLFLMPPRPPLLRPRLFGKKGGLGHEKARQVPTGYKGLSLARLS